jgi:hypothetical protein
MVYATTAQSCNHDTRSVMPKPKLNPSAGSENNWESTIASTCNCHLPVCCLHSPTLFLVMNGNSVDGIHCSENTLITGCNISKITTTWIA